MPQERLDIVISQKGAKTVKKDINSIGKEAEKAGKSTSLLKKALGGIGAALVVREVTRLADSYTTMQNRLKTVTKSQTELNEVTSELFKISNRSRQAVQGTVEFYARLSGAAKELGKSQSELLAITETVTKAVAISGATTAESAGALRQLSQGLGSGTLRGQELNSVLEQLPIIADIIAESLGVARGELRGLAEQGKLTGDVVISALEGAAGRIDAAYAESVATIGQAFDVLRNSVTQYIGEVDQATGVSRFLSQAIITISENLNTLIPLLITVAGITAFNSLVTQATLFIGTLGRGIALVKSLRVALLGLSATQGAAAAVASGAPSAAVSALLAGGGATAGTGALTAGLGIAAVKIGALVAASYALVKGLEFAAEEGKEISAEFINGAAGLREMDFVATDLQKTMAQVARNAGRIGDILKKPTADNLIPLKEAAAIYAELNREQLQFEAARDLGRKLDENELLGVAKNIVQQLRDKSFTEDFSLLPEEIAGAQADVTAAKIGVISKRIAELNRAKEAGAISSEEFGKAMRFRNEELDNLTGGVAAELEEVTRQIELFNLAKGDADLTSKFDQSNFEAVGLLMDKRKELQGLIDAEKENARATEEAAAAERNRSAAVERSLTAMREQVRLFGQTNNQRQIDQLRKNGADDGQIAEAESLQKQAAILQQFSDIVGGGTALFAEIIAFQEQAAALQQQTSNAAQTVQAEASLSLAEGTQAIAQASQTLFGQVSTFLKSAADLALAEVELKFASGAATIGTATAQAFATAFSGGLSGALGSILGNISFNSGSLGNLLGAGANAAGNGGTVSPALAAQIRQVEDAKLKVQQLKQELDNVGQAATTNFNRGSAAAQQFGQNTTNIGTQINNVFSNAFGGLESALTQFVTTGKLDFKSLINSIIADLARMVVQMLIIKPLMGFFGGIFGGFFGFSQGGFVGSNLPGFATGGIVGGFGGSTSDNQLARLSPGEFVMNAKSTKKNRAALEYTNSTGKMPVVQGGGSGSMVFAPTIIVNSEGGGSEGGESTAMDIEATVRRLWTEMAVKSERSGAVFGRNRTGG